LWGYQQFYDSYESNPSQENRISRGVDRIFDMSRTAVNVTGDLVACAILDRWTEGSVAQPTGTEPEIAAV